LKLFPISAGEILFSLKTFAAALLALWIAFLWNLSQPYWAMLTVLIVAQPYTGMVRSKALYRFVGTFVGAGMAVFLVPNLVNLPLLLVVALGLWIALCLYLSLIDGTPRSYAYILSGYTVALIGFPSVLHPNGIFGTALARVEEVSLGILATFVINELFFPRSAVGLYFGKASALLEKIRKTGEGILASPPGTALLETARGRLAVEQVALGPLALFASYDTRNPARLRSIDLLRYKMGHLLPSLSEIVRHIERIHGEYPECLEESRKLLDTARAWLREGGASPIPSFRTPEEAFSGAAGPPELALENLAARLREFCLALSECLRLSHEKEPPGPAEKVFEEPPHRDHLLASLSALSIFLTVLAVSFFWILTEWPDGATATMMAAVATSFFAAQDDPAPAILRFMTFLTAGSATGILFLYGLLPMAQDFLTLSVLLALVLIPAGIFLGRPETTIPVLAFSIGFGGLIALSSTYHANFMLSMNAAIAQSAGVFLAATMTRLVRSVGASVSVRRLYRADLRDLAGIAAMEESAPLSGALARIVDRTGQLALRLQALPKGQRSVYGETFLHAGLARTLFHLAREESGLPDPLRGDVVRLRESFRRFFEQRSRGGSFSAVHWAPGHPLLDHLPRRGTAESEILPLLSELEILAPPGSVILDPFHASPGTPR